MYIIFSSYTFCCKFCKNILIFSVKLKITSVIYKPVCYMSLKSIFFIIRIQSISTEKPLFRGNI